MMKQLKPDVWAGLGGSGGNSTIYIGKTGVIVVDASGEVPEDQSSMQIRVLFFGVLKDLIGRSSEALELAEGSKAGAVLRHYSQKAPRIAAMMPSVATISTERSG